MDRVHEHREYVDEEMFDDDALSDEEMSDDDELSDESVPIDDESVPDDKIWNQIVGDDPNLTSLRVGINAYHPPDGDWASLGSAIGRNKHLKELILLHELREEYFDGFFHGLRSNQSIQTLRFNMRRIDDHGANIVANGLISKAPLNELDIRGADKVTHIGWLGIFAALKSNPDCRLQKLYLHFNIINQAAALLLSDVLLRHNTTLKTVELISTTSIQDVSIAGWDALFRPLRSSNSLLERVNLSYCSITDEVLAALTNALANNSTLRELDLSKNCYVTVTGWVAFSVVLRNPNSALENLELSYNHINDNVINSFPDALANNNKLKELILSGNHDVTPTGWSALSVVLRNPNSALEKLDLGYNRINDNVINSFSDALANNNKLKELKLRLSVSDDITPMGWSALSVVLRNPNSALEKLDLGCNHINDNVMITFSDALSNNNKLKELILNVRSRVVTTVGSAAFIRVLCDRSSILSTYHSNHTLEKLCDESNEELLSEDLRSLLQLNRENNKSQAARLKIIKSHFSGSEINTQIFIDMESKVLPTAIAWMGRAGGSVGATDVLFAFLTRSLPLLCDMKNDSKKS